MATREQLLSARRKAYENGDQRAVTRYSERLEEGGYDEESSGFKSAALGSLQGATLGGSDEAMAAIGAGAEKYVLPYINALTNKFGSNPNLNERTLSELVDMERTEGGYMDAYNRNLQAQRGDLETARREDPWTTGLAEFGGGLLVGGPAMQTAVKGQKLGRGMFEASKTGAKLGAGAGYGYGEGDVIQAAITGERLPQEALEAGMATGGGAAVGATVGAAIPAVVAGVRRFVIKPFTGKARINEEGRNKVMAALQEDIDNGYITLDQAKRELADTPGMVTADLGPALRELTETVAQTPTAAARGVRETLTTRNKEQHKRIFPNLAEAIGAKDNFSAARRALIKDMKEKAAAAYGLAYQIPIRMTPRMKEIFTTPSGKLALAQGKILRKELEKNPKALDMKGAMQSTRDIDYIIQAYDDVVGGLFKTGKGARGQAAKNLRNELREEVYSQNQPYREARKQWSGDKLNDDAMDKGLKVLRDDADITADIVREMGESERIFFKIGALRAIARKLGNKSDTSDIQKGMFDSPNKREALQVAFGSKQKFSEFMEYIAQEQKMFQTFSEAVGNSKTARRLASADDPGAKLAALFGYTTAMGTGASIPPSIGGYVGRKAYETLMPKGRAAARARDMGQRQADLLMSPNLDDLMRPQTLGGLLGTGIPETAAAGTGGLLSTGLFSPETQYGR